MTPGEEVVAASDAARAQLPAALAELSASKEALAAAQTRVDAANVTIKTLLRDTIKSHQQVGKIGITKMADGTQIFWLPRHL